MSISVEIEKYDTADIITKSTDALSFTVINLNTSITNKNTNLFIKY